MGITVWSHPFGVVTVKLIALAEYAAREKIVYNEALRRALRAEIPAERLSGRWYVHSDALVSVEPAAALPDDAA